MLYLCNLIENPSTSDTPYINLDNATYGLDDPHAELEADLENESTDESEDELKGSKTRYCLDCKQDKSITGLHQVVYKVNINHVKRRECMNMQALLMDI